MEITPHILQRYHQGLCNPDEERIIRQWLETGSLDIQEELLPLVENEEYVADSIWQSIAETENLQTLSQQKHIKAYSLRKRFFTWGIAASILLMVGFSALYYANTEEVASKSIVMKTIRIPYGKKALFTLPDGTAVHLNSGSELRYPERFADTERRVRLVGEAFFEVFQDKRRPFLVETNATATEVLGTTFNLSAYPDEDYSLIVQQGKVSFGNSIRKEMFAAGQGGIYTKKGELKRMPSVAEEKLGWKNSQLIFQRQTLIEMAIYIERWYGVEIDIQNSQIAQRLFTGSFDNPSLPGLMKNLSFVMQFNYRIQAQKITIY